MPSPAPRSFALASSGLALVDVLQIGFNGEIGAELLRANDAQLGKTEFRSEREGHAALTGDLRRVKDKKFVDDAGRERRAVQCRAGLEEHAQDIAAAKFPDDSGQIHAPIFCSC